MQRGSIRATRAASLAGRHVEANDRFAQNLRAHRLNAGLSQERLAFVCNLHRTEISLLERAAREPRLSTIVRLARGLGVAPVVLLDGIE